MGTDNGISVAVVMLMECSEVVHFGFGRKIYSPDDIAVLMDCSEPVVHFDCS
jgi:hypothetical protein